MSQFDAPTEMQGERTRAEPVPGSSKGTGPLPTGTQLGPWTLGKLLGAGAMGAVYEAEDEAGLRAAVKVLIAGQDEKSRKRFLREAKVTQKVRHKNVIRCLGSDSEAKTPWIALEFVEGEDLYAVMQRDGKMSLEQVRPLAQGILRGLRAAHQAGVLHRDLKPANVLVARFGEVKLADFGLARRDEESLSITVSGQLMGTPYYMSPEQVQGLESIGPPSDVYAIGAILFHLFSGQPPFQGKLTEILGGHLNQPPPPLKKAAPGLPKRLLELIHGCLEKEAEKRPSLDDLLAAFSVVGAGTAQLRPQDRGEQPRKRSQRRPPPAGSQRRPRQSGRPSGRPRPGSRRPPEGGRKGPEGKRTTGRPRPDGQRPRPPSEGQRPRSDGRRARPESSRPRPEGQRPRPETGRPRAETGRPKKRAESEGRRPRSSVAARARRSRVDPYLPAERLPEVPPAQPPPERKPTTDPLYSRLLDAVAALLLLVSLARCADLAMGGRLLHDVEAVHQLRELLSAPRFMVLLGITGLAIGQRVLSRGGSRPGFLDRLLLRRKARGLESRGQILQAARLYERLGDRRGGAELLASKGRHEAAAQMFLDDGDGLRAGEALERAGRRAEALELYRACEAMEAAFRVALADDSPHAAAYLLRYGQVDDAVEVLHRGKQRYAAADLLEREGRLADALLILEEGYRERDASGYWNHLERAGREPEALRQLGGRVAWIQEKLGYAARAAALYEELGEWTEAAEVYAVAGMRNEEVDCTLVACEEASELSQEQRNRVATLATELERERDPRAAAFLKLLDRPVAAAKLLEGLGQHEEAAELYASAGRLGEAAHCAERAGNIAVAAGHYADSGELERAAKLYEQAKLYELAAKQYERAGNKEEAVRLRVQLGDPLDGARQLVELGRDAEAAKLLAGIRAESADHYDASLLRADIHRRAGRHEEALELYNECLGEGIRFREELVPHLNRIACYEALGQVDSAVGGLEDLRQTSFAPGDLEKRLAALQSQSKAPPKAITGDTSRFRATAIPDKLVGETIDRYQLERMLGIGSFAWVYEAKHTSLGRRVALKVLKPTLCTGETPERFLREGRALATLEDKNLIKVYDAGEAKGLSYLALEFVDGPTLKEWFEKHTPCSVAKAAQIGVGILSGLAAAHARQIVHRDLKPANVLVATGDVVKVVDFGIARLMDDGTKTRTADFLGTPRYASPEQARGDKPDVAADQYAAALIIYEALTGRLPFTSSTTLGWLTQHMSSEPEPLSKHAKDVPAPFADAVMKALAKQPDERFADADGMKKALLPFVNS